MKEKLGVVIGKKAKNVKESEALSYVLGCSIVNDVSARDYHQQDKSFARSKGVDTFCPFGPFIVTGLNPDQPENRDAIEWKDRAVFQYERSSIQSLSVDQFCFQVHDSLARGFDRHRNTFGDRTDEKGRRG